MSATYETAKNLFTRTRPETRPAAANAGGAQPEPVEPTSTPLPMHFPTVEDDELHNSKRAASSLLDAFKACWPQVEVSTDAASEAMTLANIEKLFGKIKKREILETIDTNRRLGLLFDNTVFPGGAAGSATEANDTLQDFQVRAAGQMLHCDDADRCECLSSVGP